ncbi:FG-GAP repeat domain-containing protein [Pontibacter pamirensis]|uniref:FG-GAP repeat domain-containing protein n=1 Tax=Pontibacter pamirensis TaxID=2562824 RepID=UPI001389F9B8|nr:VCBS repeat-containing protein [Pontibacter pamirensis]
MRFRYLLLCLAIITGCTGNSDKNRLEEERVSLQGAMLPDTTETLHLTGEQLAQAYCRTCHAFPEPELLDKATWQHGVLPQMALRLGINKTGNNIYMDKTLEEITALLQAGIFPDIPLIAERDFDKIEAYYLLNAPEQLPLPASPDLQPELGGFSVVTPDLNKGKYALTTLVKYEPATQTLWVGDLRNWIFKLNKQLQVIDSVQVESAPVDLIQDKGAYKVLSIGVMDPSEQRKGKLVQFYDSKKGKVPETLLEGLQRPVAMVMADLDEDKLQDIIVCNYGNNMGQLVWYQNIGQGKYRSNILKDLPGARKAEVVDLDRDGRQDLVVLFAQGTETIKVFYNKGRGKFEEKNLVQFPPVYGLSYFELADFNKDGFPDLLVSNGDNADHSPVLKPYHGIRIFLNDGKNKFSEAYFYPMPGASKVLARDFDQDGDLDIAAISFFPDFKRAPEKGFVYLQQEKSFTFTASTFSQSQLGHWLTMEAGDYDQDGDEDIILGSFIYTPAPPAVQEKWKKEGPGLVVLQNQKVKKGEKIATLKVK